MKKETLKTLGGAVLAAFTLAVVAQIWVPAQDDTGKGARALEGTWLNQTQILNCQTGQVTQSFSKFTAFHMGGTANEASSSSLFRTTSFGNWEHTGPNSFRYGLQAFRFNPDGTAAGGFRAVWTVTYDPDNDTYTSTGAIQILALNGTVIANQCGAESATRSNLLN